MPPAFLTIPMLAKLLDEPAWKVRRAVDTIRPPVPRHGLYRMVPTEMLESVRERVTNYKRKK